MARSRAAHAMRVRLVPLTLLAVVIGCSEAPEAPQASPAPAEGTAPEHVSEPAGTPDPTVPLLAPSGPFDVAEVVLQTAGGEEITLSIHVAAEPETRARGLMHRDDVLPGTGMLFLFPEDTTSGFWMKNTLVPLSIAFAADDGRILRILDMEPCPDDPCPVYDPGTSYRTALEVPAGDFERLGVSEGDLLITPADLPPAR